MRSRRGNRRKPVSSGAIFFGKNRRIGPSSEEWLQSPPILRDYKPSFPHRAHQFMPGQEPPISADSVGTVSRLLSGARQGDPGAAAELFPLVYKELRNLARQRMANERAGHTLQATALVHEAYLKLLGGEKAQWAS